ncbi:MAG: sigma 54-interacting transcriptional regulator [Planctomycetes bacterium]|nr:sigma 54-interacting transcriptional regulator [Planctomycetota bacterium]
MTGRAAWLVVLTGPGQGTRHPLDGKEVPIGRSPPGGITLPDTKASRHHVTLARDGASWRVRDEGSRNGTRLNGKAVREAALTHLDILEVGSTRLRFLSEEAPAGAGVAGEGAGEPDDALGGTDDAPPITETLDSTQLRLLRREREASVPAGGEREGAAGISTEALRQAHERLVELVDFARTAASCATTADLLRLACARVRELLSADRVVAFLRSPDGTLQPVPAEEVPASPVPEGPGVRPQPVPRGIVERAVSQRVAVLSRRPESDDRFADRPSVALGGLSTAMAAPLMRGDVPRGGLYADRLGSAEAFTRSELEFLMAFGAVASDALRAQEELDRMSREVDHFARDAERRFRIVGDSPRLREVLAFVDRAGPTDAPILLTGESGTGKELVARAIHSASRRARFPFEVVSCGAIVPDLIEGELFGHVRGAFTGAVEDRAGRFEAASGGTLFLDEVGDLPAPCQATLLRALEHACIRRVGDTAERPVDVRLVSASRNDLLAAVKEGRFREDLFYRLHVLSVTLPPLRERPEDVGPLAEHFLRLLAAEIGRPVPALEPSALERLRRHPWPGNVRELRNVLERVLVESPRRSLRGADFPDALLVPPSPDALGPQDLPGSWKMEDLESWHLSRALAAAGGNKAKAAQMLGIDRSTLYAKMKKYGIEEKP